MPKSFPFHSIALITSIIGVFFWANTTALSAWTLQLVGLLVLGYAAAHWLNKKKSAANPHISLDLTLLATVSLLLVAETGALTSPFFFILYFLLFAVAMLYEIETTLVLTGSLILFFAFFPGTNLASLTHLSELLALVMITPLAIYTGHQYERVLEEKQKTLALSSHLSQQETDTLLFLSLNLKKTLLSALDGLSLAVPQVKVKKLRTDLDILYQDLRNLYRSADELQQMIDRESDDLK
jgi:hypothetical protein